MGGRVEKVCGEAAGECYSHPPPPPPLSGCGPLSQRSSPLASDCSPPCSPSSANPTTTKTAGQMMQLLCSAAERTVAVFCSTCSCCVLQHMQLLCSTAPMPNGQNMQLLCSAAEHAVIATFVPHRCQNGAGGNPCTSRPRRARPSVVRPPLPPPSHAAAFAAGALPRRAGTSCAGGKAGWAQSGELLCARARVCV